MSAESAIREAQGRRLRRLTLVGCAAGLFIAWGTLIPLKLTGPVPPHLTWPVVVLHPVTLFGWLASLVVLPILYPHRAVACIFGASAIAVVVALLVWGLSVPGFFGPGRP